APVSAPMARSSSGVVGRSVIVGVVVVMIAFWRLGGDRKVRGPVGTGPRSGSAVGGALEDRVAVLRELLGELLDRDRPGEVLEEPGVAHAGRPLVVAGHALEPRLDEVLRGRDRGLPPECRVLLLQQLVRLDARRGQPVADREPRLVLP